MAKALFKSWFVDFDPVRAKAEGRPTGLPAEISDLFPDSFEDSELGEIPSGWRVGRLRDCCEYHNRAITYLRRVLKRRWRRFPASRWNQIMDSDSRSRRIYCYQRNKQASWSNADRLDVVGIVNTCSGAFVQLVDGTCCSCKSKAICRLFIYYLYRNISREYLRSPNSEGTVNSDIIGKIFDVISSSCCHRQKQSLLFSTHCSSNG